MHTCSPDCLEKDRWGQSHLVHYRWEAILQKADDRWPTELITLACCGSSGNLHCGQRHIMLNDEGQIDQLSAGRISYSCLPLNSFKP